MASLMKEFAHLQIPLEEIVSATNNFADENIIGRGGFGKVYKGQLLRSGETINIVARRLDRASFQGRTEFWTEISMFYHLKNENIVTNVGFCDENDERIIINKHEVNGSLDKYLSGSTLTWIQRLEICTCAAGALSYIHYDKNRDYGVIHRNIKSSKILLNENWEAKISGFGLSIANPATRKHRLLLSEACGTIGYVDPIYVETGGVTNKSDVYSFGVVLFEVLCGRKSVLEYGKNPTRFLSELAKLHYQQDKLDEIIDPDLRKQMHTESLSIFSGIAYDCLNRQRAQRPDMDQVVKKLEKALELQRRHENQILKEHSTDVEDASSNYWKGKNVEHLKISFSDIKSATENFSNTSCIGSGAYGKVFKAELEHFDNKNSSKIQEMNNGKVPKRRSIVAIKRISSRKDVEGEQEFLKEIEMLTSCKHRNIISLLGFCDEDGEMIFVYEHASNGSLDDYLGSSNDTWAQRLRMCIDIAHGLNYLHNHMIIHQDIKSANILLDHNLVAKIADFGLSKFRDMNQSYLDMTKIGGTEYYMDPEYPKTYKLKKESDIYSFGVVLFEIMCGRMAYDPIYIAKDDKGLAPIARRRFNEGTIKEMIDLRIMEETDQNIFTLNKGPDQESMDTFLEIANRCVAETQAKRPTMEVVINELEKALHFQENRKDDTKISLEDIKLATRNFSDDNYIGKGGFGKVYKGELRHANGRKIVAVKRLDRHLGQGELEFLTELEILFEHKHENVIGLVGYCDEMDEKIIVYEHASHGSLDKHLNDPRLMWIKRIKICIDIARGLDSLHGGVETQERVIHRDIKSSNILLTCDWEVKITDFGLSLITPTNKAMDYVIENAAGTFGYVDPLYVTTGFLTKESDIYSFGVVLFEIMCGRLACLQQYHDEHRYLSSLVRSYFEKGKLDEIVFDGIKEKIVPESLSTFCTIAYQCLHDEREKRPSANDVVGQLQKALEFQEDYEIWEPKLPRDYKETIQMSRSPEIYSTEKKKDLYEILSKGILLQEGKVWFSLSIGGERNEMISARKFSYKNRRSLKWRSVPKSRFGTVAQMLDISNLKIQIQIKTQFLSPDVIYGAHLVFKFCDPTKFSSKPMYVNLKYKMGSETLHAYFATWRDEWMMIELCRFLNHKETTDFKVLLESFSRYYCASGAIYVEGIVFRAVDNVKHEEIEKLTKMQQVLKSNSNMDEVQQKSTDYEKIFMRSKNQDEGEKLFSIRKVDGKKCHMLPAKAVLFDSSNVKLFNWKPLTQSRFQEVVELLAHQVVRIKCKIESQMLSPNTEYECYLVFKVSEKCLGLRCPVRVRDLLHRKNKETEILYFRSPSPLNLHDIDRVPKQREDGWMEVNVWKFDSNHEPKNDYLAMDLKLICYEGTMCGLIVCGLELRPM